MRPAPAAGSATETDKLQLAIVIPAHNEEKLLGRCLESVMAEVRRSGFPVDVVVVDNASVDRTAEIAAAVSGVRVVTELTKGLVHARAAGFDATTAELIANVDADTLMPEGWITTVMEEFVRDEGLVALSGPYKYYDLGAWPRFVVLVFYWFAYLTYLLARFVLRKGSMIQGGNFVIKRDAWISVVGYDKTITFYGEDTDVAVRLSRVGKVKWTFRLPMLTSGRRLEHEGVFRTGFSYTINYFNVLFRGKPVTYDYQDIRKD